MISTGASRSVTVACLTAIASCGGDDDGPAQARIDAAPPDAGVSDAAPPDARSIGLDSPCCEPDQVCAEGLFCLADFAGDRRCRNPCEGAGQDECPPGGVCAALAPASTPDAGPKDPPHPWSIVDCSSGPSADAGAGPVLICLPAQSEGEECAPELCDQLTICVGDSADSATCLRRCMKQGDCARGTTCMTVSGSGAMACFPR